MPEFPEIWVVSFGARWMPGVGWQPSFLAARELSSQRSVALDHVALFATPIPPYPTDGNALLIGFVGEGIVGCHIVLRWALPAHIVDLQVEFRNLANGHPKPCGDGVAGALIWFGLPGSGGINCCQTLVGGHREVAALELLFLAMRSHVDLPRAVLRGRFLIAIARIETTGIPIDVTKLDTLRRHWRNIIRHVGIVIFDAKPNALAIRSDHRLCAGLRPFSSRTGRNQPNTAEFLLAAPGWLRRLITPHVGRGLAIVDWRQHEFGIAAALSGDERMKGDYQSGDPYMAFADRYRENYAPSGRGSRRDAFKACALGVLNGIGPSSLARQIGCSQTEARLLLQEHRAGYPQFWRWSDGIEMEAYLCGRLQSVFGWGVAVNAASNPRFLRNFPLQSNGAEMLRLACCLATESGVLVCAPNHDALLIEAPLDELADAIKSTEAAMAEASEIVLEGFRLRTSVTAIRYPDHYPHPRSDALWLEIDRSLAELGESSEPAHQCNTSCAQTHPRPISLYVYDRRDRSDGCD